MILKDIRPYTPPRRFYDYSMLVFRRRLPVGECLTLALMPPPEAPSCIDGDAARPAPDKGWRGESRYPELSFVPTPLSR